MVDIEEAVLWVTSDWMHKITNRYQFGWSETGWGCTLFQSGCEARYIVVVDVLSFETKMRKTDFKTNCRLLFETRNARVGKCSRKLIWKKWRKPRWKSSNLTKLDEENFSVWEIQSTISNNNNKKMIMNLSHKFSKSIAMLVGIRLWMAKINMKYLLMFQRLCDLFSWMTKLWWPKSLLGKLSFTF